jgi:hypothetical protein
MNAEPTTTPRSSASSLAGLDPGFLRRVHLTGLVLALVSSAFALYYAGPHWALGFFCASLWSVTNLWVLERLLRAALQPRDRNTRTILVAGSLKIPILYALLLWMLAGADFPAVAVLTGMSIPLVVIVLKVAGRLIAPRDDAAARNAHPVDPS